MAHKKSFIYVYYRIIIFTYSIIENGKPNKSTLGYVRTNDE
jgi:hypothetical protein